MISVSLKNKLLRFLTKKKTTSSKFSNVQKILFLRYDRIGDMVLTTPVFRELKRERPNISISVLCSKSNKDIIKDNPYIDHIFLNAKNSFLVDLPTLLKLRKKKFDALIEFDHSVVAHAIIRIKIINPKLIISPEKSGRYGVPGKDLKLYDIYTPKKENEHLSKTWLRTIEPFGVFSDNTKYDLFLSKNCESKALNFLKKNHDKFKIGINLEGAVKGKKIKFDELNEICEELSRISNSQIFILSSPSNYIDVENWVLEKKLPGVSQIYLTKSILDISAIIKHLNLVISPDTSIVHIASVYDVPIISIHEDNLDSYKLFAPQTKIHRTVFSKDKKSLDGYSIKNLINYTKEIMHEINKM